MTNPALALRARPERRRRRAEIAFLGGAAAFFVSAVATVATVCVVCATPAAVIPLG